MQELLFNVSYFISILSIICGTILSLFAFKETALLQLTSMVALFGLFVSFIMAIIHSVSNWKLKPLHSLLPLLITILCGLGPEVGIFLRNIHFRTQIPQLEKVIQSFETTGSLTGYLYGADKWYGETYATFLWGGGFPVKHTVLLYSSSSSIKDYCKTTIGIRLPN